MSIELPIIVVAPVGSSWHKSIRKKIPSKPQMVHFRLTLLTAKLEGMLQHPNAVLSCVWAAPYALCTSQRRELHPLARHETDMFMLKGPDVLPKVHQSNEA